MTIYYWLDKLSKCKFSILIFVKFLDERLNIGNVRNSNKPREENLNLSKDNTKHLLAQLEKLVTTETTVSVLVYTLEANLNTQI